MYNEDLKREFIKHYTNSQNTARICENLFNTTEAYEKKWRADLCTQKADVLQPLINEVSGLRTRSKWSRLAILKEYVRWCISVANVPNACDDIFKINSTGLDKIRQQMVANPIQLQSYLDAVYSKEAEMDIDNTMRCYVWLAYAGVPEDDIVKIKTEDICLSEMKVVYNGKEYPLYRESVPAFRNCIELTQFRFNHPRYTKECWQNRIDGNLLLRGIKTEPTVDHFRILMSKATKKSDKTDLRLSYFRIWLSGKFYRAREKEVAGITPDFSDIVQERVGDRIYKLDSGRNTQEAKRRWQVWEYEVDYQRWKLAFYV